MATFSLVALTCIIVLRSENTDAQAIIASPADVTRVEGENEFIPCPFDGDITPLWKINDTFYHFTSLPCPFTASTSPVGLIITVVDRSISGTSFQCFAPGAGSDTSVMASSIGVLTVAPNTLYGGDGVDTDLTTLSIQLVAQRIWFRESEAFLGWSIFDKEDVIEVNTSLRYTLYKSNCDIANNASAVESSTNSYAQLSLSNSTDMTDVYYSISAFDEAGNQSSTINEPFRIDSGVVTKSIPVMIGSTCPVCVDIPQPEVAPFFSIRRSASNKRDSQCKAVRVPGEEDHCLDLVSNCDGFSETSFVSSLTICSTSSSTNDYKMCFSNVTREMNNTRIHFFYSLSLPCRITITGRRVTSRLFIDSYEIIAQEPIIDDAVNTSSGELCLSSLPRDCFLPTNYNITVKDVTGYVVSKRLAVPDGQCTQIDILQLSDSECAPFHIAIDAYNPTTIYQTVYRTVGNEETSSLCNCAQQRAQVNLREIMNGVEISCSRTSYNYGINFIVVVMDKTNGTTVFNSGLLECTTDNQTVELSSAIIMCNRDYSVAANFSFPNGTSTTCVVSNVITILAEDCPTSDAPTFGPTQDIFILAIIALPIALVVICLVIIVICVVIIVKVYKESGTYRPRRAEREHGTDVEQKPNSNTQPTGIV